MEKVKTAAVVVGALAGLAALVLEMWLNDKARRMAETYNNFDWGDDE